MRIDQRDLVEGDEQDPQPASAGPNHEHVEGRLHLVDDADTPVSGQDEKALTVVEPVALAPRSQVKSCLHVSTVTDLLAAAIGAEMRSRCGFSATTIRPGPDGAWTAVLQSARMHRTYAVTWQEPGSVPYSGKLELRACGLSLEGSNNGSGTSSLLIPYEELLGMRLASGHERLDGRPTLVLDRRGRGSLRVASVVAPGIISEVAEALAGLRLGNAAVNDRVAVVVPIRKGKRDKVEQLLDKGPPFEPERVGLGRHQVFLTDQEAVFFFESAEGFSLQRLLADTKVWASAAVWHDCIAGPPRTAKAFYSWAAPSREDESLSFAATPGPGDSEGGDIYSP